MEVVVADSDVVEQVEEEVHVLRALGQNLLLGGRFIIITVTISTQRQSSHFGGEISRRMTFPTHIYRVVSLVGRF